MKLDFTLKISLGFVIGAALAWAIARNLPQKEH